MAIIQDLPSLILRNVFSSLYKDHAISNDAIYHDLDRIKSLVPATAVCRQWRQEALPYLCSVAVCECTDSISSHDNESSSSRIGRRADVRWKTNIGIIVSNNLSCCTSEFVLNVSCLGESGPAETPNSANIGLVDVLEMCGFGSVSWSNVLSLQLFGIDDDAVVDVGVSAEERKAEYPGYLISHLPNVQRVVTDYCVWNKKNVPGVCYLIDQYMPQLTCLSIQSREGAMDLV